VKRERGEEEESECVSECVSEGVMQKKRKTVSKRQVKEEQHTVTPSLTHSHTHSLVPDPFALDLIRKTSGKKSGSGVTAEVSEDPSSGDPCAVSLSLPHSATATTTVEKFYIIQLLTVDVDSGSVYYLFSRCVCMYACMYACMYRCVYGYGWMKCVCMYVCVCVCVCV
jgi:hypothetical protein